MSAVVTCPKGHQWDPFVSGQAWLSERQAVCPLCGMAVELSPSVMAQAALNRTLDHAPVPGPADQVLSAASTLAGVGPSSETGPVTRVNIPGYEVLGELGRGGMGIVYQARQKSLKRLVALKMVLAGAHADAEVLHRFRVEAEAAARLQHPHIVEVYEIGEWEGCPYFSMQYVEGGSLDRKLNGTPLPPPQAAQLLETVSRAMHHAHQQGVVHRDLKPSNILVTTSGSPKVVDFGLAKLAGGEGAVRTQTGSILGTPSYMAPEQALGKGSEIGPLTDVYALGAILYETLTGRPPFRGATLLETLDQVRTQEPVAPSRLQPGVPRDLETVCLKALSKDPRRRYESAEALADDLGRFLAGRPVQAQPVSSGERVWRWCRRNPALAGLATVTVAAVLALIILSIGFGIQQSRAAAELGREKQKTEAALVEAERNLHQARYLSASFALDRGLTLCNQGNIGRGLLWLAHSLQLAPNNEADLQRAIRGNLAGWYQRLNPLRACLPHKGGVWAVAFGPDGKLVLTGCQDNTARLWDARTGAPLGQPLPHQGWVEDVAFSPDGQTVLTGSRDRLACLWEAPSGRLLASFRHEDEVLSVAFGPGGRTVFTGTADGTAHLWEAASGKRLVELRPPSTSPRPNTEELTPDPSHKGEYVAVALGPDGKTALTADRDRAALLWDTGTGRVLHTLRHEGKVLAVAFSPDGKVLATGSADRKARLWEAASGKLLSELAHEGSVLAMAFSPDSQMLLTGGGDETARLWEVSSGKLLGQFEHQGEIRALAFSRDGVRAMTGSYDQTARLWQTAGGRPVGQPLQHLDEVWGVAFAPDGRTLLTGSGGLNGDAPRGEARLWGASAGEFSGLHLRHPEAVCAVAYSPDGQTVLTSGSTGDGKGLAWLWDASTGRRLRVFEGHRGPVWAVAFSPDGRTVLTGGQDNTARMWDAATGKEVRVLQGHKDLVRAVAYSPDGQMLLTGSYDGSAWLWDAATGQRLRELVRNQGPVWAVAFSPDGKRAVTAGWDQMARFWDTTSGQAVGRPVRHQDTITSVAYSLDGRTILTGSKDRTAQLWDARTREPLGPPFQPERPVQAVALSPDGQIVLTGDRGGTVWLWDAATGKRIGPPLHYQADINGAAFSPDGHTILTGSGDNNAWLTRLPGPVEGDAERVVLWAQVRTGLELDAGGGVRGLDARAWRERHDRLQQAVGSSH